MKKFLLILSSLLFCSLSAEQTPQTEGMPLYNHINMLHRDIFITYLSCINKAKEKGYQFVVIDKIEYTDNMGQTFQWNSNYPLEKEIDHIKESLVMDDELSFSAFKPKVLVEMLCFKEKPLGHQ